MISNVRTPQIFPIRGIDQKSDSSSIFVFKTAHLAFFCEMILFYCRLLPSPSPRSRRRDKLAVPMDGCSIFWHAETQNLIRLFEAVILVR